MIGREENLLAATNSIRIRGATVVDFELNVRHELHGSAIVLDSCKSVRGKKNREMILRGALLWRA